MFDFKKFLSNMIVVVTSAMIMVGVFGLLTNVSSVAPMLTSLHMLATSCLWLYWLTSDGHLTVTITKINKQED